MKVSSEISSGLSSLVQVHGTILQQLRIHKNICKLWGYEKLAAVILTQNDSVCSFYLLFGLPYEVELSDSEPGSEMQCFFYFFFLIVNFTL